MKNVLKLEFDYADVSVASVGPRLLRRNDGQLELEHEGRRFSPVFVRRCFPWSQPLAFLSVRDHSGAEILLIDDVAKLDIESREALALAVAESGFVFEIESILEIREEFELRVWRVRTAQGERCFQTRLNAWPREMPSGSLLVQDVGGDLYRIRDPKQLDPASEKKLWAFMDEDE